MLAWGNIIELFYQSYDKQKNTASGRLKSSVASASDIVYIWNRTL